MPQQHVFRPCNIPCPFKESKGCSRLFTDHSGATRHAKAVHRAPAHEAATIQSALSHPIPPPPLSPPDDKNHMGLDSDLGGEAGPHSPILNAQTEDHHGHHGDSEREMPQMEGQVLHHPLLNGEQHELFLWMYKL